MKKFAGIFLGLFLLCGVSDAAVVTEQMLSESDLENKIEDRIAEYHEYEIRYYIYNRNVILASKMPRDRRDTLMNTIRGIRGVDHVIYVDAGDDSFKQSISDSVITAKVEAKLFSIKGVNSFRAHVKTIGGGICCVFASLEKGTSKQKVVDELKKIDGVNNIVFCYSYR